MSLGGVKMVLSKKMINYIAYTAFTLLLLAILTMGIIKRLDTLENYASLFIAFTSFSILLFNGLRTHRFKWAWVFLALVPFFYFLSDLIWIIFDANTNEMIAATLDWFYTLVNVSIVTAILMYFNYRKRNFEISYVLLDVGFIVIISVFSVGVLFKDLFDINVQALTQARIGWPLVSLLTIMLDATALATMALIYLASPTKKIPTAFRLMVLGIITYIISDFFYIFFSYFTIYTGYWGIDLSYSLALVLLGLSALVDWLDPEMGTARIFDVEQKGLRFNYRIYPIYAIPFAVLLFIEFSWLYLLFYGLVFFVRRSLISYIRNIKNQKMLLQEMIISRRLEEEVRNRTGALRESEEKYRKLSEEDPLTGLYNRRYMYENFQQWQPEKPFVLFYIDLDRFKEINDTFGHGVGDQILREVSNRIRQVSMGRGLVARIGGDEFMMTIDGDLSSEAIEVNANLILESLKQAIMVKHQKFAISCSMGIVKYPLHAVDSELLIQYADIAMYHAKQLGRDQWHLFSDALMVKILRKNSINLALNSASYEDELILFYQAQVDTVTQEVLGAEALIRWNSSVLGFISPAEFIPLSEENGSIIPLGYWVMEQALKQLSLWNQKYVKCKNFRLGINVSPKQFEDHEFIPRLQSLIERIGIDPFLVDIEITENSAMTSDSELEEVLTAIAGIGCQVSIDDFGMGYSSLSYIKRFDIDRLKIAKELTDEIEVDFNTQKIVKAIIELARILELKTIAEGVETQEQYQVLRDLGCDEIQGYYFSKPVDAQTFEQQFLLDDTPKNSIQ